MPKNLRIQEGEWIITLPITETVEKLAKVVLSLRSGHMPRLPEGWRLDHI